MYLSSLAGRQCIVKERFSKGYRHPELDKKLTFRRTSQEARCIVRCRAAGIPTPALLYLDVAASKLYVVASVRGPLPSPLPPPFPRPLGSLYRYDAVPSPSPSLTRKGARSWRRRYLEYIDDALTIRDFLWKAEGSAEQQTEALQAVGRLIVGLHLPLFCPRSVAVTAWACLGACSVLTKAWLLAALLCRHACIRSTSFTGISQRPT